MSIHAPRLGELACLLAVLWVGTCRGQGVALRQVEEILLDAADAPAVRNTAALCRGDGALLFVTAKASVLVFNVSTTNDSVAVAQLPPLDIAGAADLAVSESTLFVSTSAGLRGYDTDSWAVVSDTAVTGLSTSIAAAPVTGGHSVHVALGTDGLKRVDYTKKPPTFEDVLPNVAQVRVSSTLLLASGVPEAPPLNTSITVIDGSQAPQPIYPVNDSTEISTAPGTPFGVLDMQLTAASACGVVDRDAPVIVSTGDVLLQYERSGGSLALSAVRDVPKPPAGGDQFAAVLRLAPGVDELGRPVFAGVVGLFEEKAGVVTYKSGLVALSSAGKLMGGWEAEALAFLRDADSVTGGVAEVAESVSVAALGANLFAVASRLGVFFYAASRNTEAPLIEPTASPTDAPGDAAPQDNGQGADCSDTRSFAKDYLPWLCVGVLGFILVAVGGYYLYQRSEPKPPFSDFLVFNELKDFEPGKV
ncbi:hypothetical protein DIPPA_06084 [Diplonema papillatum]|nr:hypothetical protein DIPPA_06084 [Diplonema papillatum]